MIIISEYRYAYLFFFFFFDQRLKLTEYILFNKIVKMISAVVAVLVVFVPLEEVPDLPLTSTLPD